jgi:hypothetical protein
MSLAALCGSVLDAAGSCAITRNILEFSTFALCRRLPPFAALWCTEKARQGQHPDAKPGRSSGDPNRPAADLAISTQRDATSTRPIEEWIRDATPPVPVADFVANKP